MIVLSHPTGNANVRNAALALTEAGLLEAFYTTVAWNPGSPLASVLPRNIAAELNRRSYAELPPERIRTSPWLEMLRLAFSRLEWEGLTGAAGAPLGIDRIYRALDRRVARELSTLPGLRAVYSYEDGAVETFRRAEELGLARLYDLPIGYWRTLHRISKEECEREPEWAATVTALHDGPEKLERKEEELRRADRVIVASSFTARTLEDSGMAKPIHIVPYGIAVPERERADAGMKKPEPGPLRLLYVGSLSQRKGISYLFSAAEKFEAGGSLTVIGRKVASCPAVDRALARPGCRWIPSLPHAGVFEEMERHDVLLFPSLFEGFGLVILEAMSRGMVVIATPHTAGIDLIRDGVDGFLVPIRSAEAISEKLERLASEKGLLEAMGREARRTAQCYTWEQYRAGLVAAIGKT